jgi:hypothetical protein
MKYNLQSIPYDGFYSEFKLIKETNNNKKIIIKNIVDNLIDTIPLENNENNENNEKQEKRAELYILLNPYRRCVLMYFYFKKLCDDGILHNNLKINLATFADFVKDLNKKWDKIIDDGWIAFLPQTKFINKNDEQIFVLWDENKKDKIKRFIHEKTKKNMFFVEYHLEESSYYYNKELKKIIEKLYQDDFVFTQSEKIYKEWKMDEIDIEKMGSVVDEISNDTENELIDMVGNIKTINPIQDKHKGNYLGQISWGKMIKGEEEKITQEDTENINVLLTHHFGNYQIIKSTKKKVFIQDKFINIKFLIIRCREGRCLLYMWLKKYLKFFNNPQVQYNTNDDTEDHTQDNTQDNTQYNTQDNTQDGVCCGITDFFIETCMLPNGKKDTFMIMRATTKNGEIIFGYVFGWEKWFEIPAFGSLLEFKGFLYIVGWNGNIYRINMKKNDELIVLCIGSTGINRIFVNNFSECEIETNRNNVHQILFQSEDEVGEKHILNLQDCKYC